MRRPPRAFFGYTVVLATTLLAMLLFLFVFQGASSEPGNWREGTGNTVALGKIELVAKLTAATEVVPNESESKYENLLSDLTYPFCGFTKNELQEVLAKPHGTRQHGARYYFDRQWVSFDELESKFDQHPEGAIECVLVHVAGQIPCRGGDCLLHFYLRMKGSDRWVLKNLVEMDEMQGLDAMGDFKTILDGGGNIGIASALFSHQYPQAQIVAVEPDLANYNLLKMNTKGRNVMAVRAGLWSKNVRLGLFGWMAWGMRVREMDTMGDEKARFTLDGISIPFVLQISGLKSFDFMKIDIEGSEGEVFARSDKNDLSYISGVKVAMVETHERYWNGSESIVRATFSEGFARTKTGEYDVFTRV